MSMEGAVIGSAPNRHCIARGIYSLFARVLDYPGAGVCQQAGELAAQLASSNSGAAESFGLFKSELTGMTLGQLQELYTGTFDMRPDRTTNLGCHLFGEDIRRNLFMAQLKERLEARHIPLGCELPDHLSLVLQLLAVEDSEEEARALVADCLAPAVARILTTFEEDAHPYANALRTLAAILDQDKAAMESIALSSS